MGNVHIGISGWSYGDWKGVFYPKGLKAGNWLSFYAQTFDTTEINASFYRLPQAQMVLNWQKKVPADFIFCPKLNKYLTHNKKLREPEEPLQRFFDVFDPIADNLGPILIQLPPALHFNLEVTQHFYEVLSGRYRGYSFAIEPRHASWLNETAIRQMKDYNIAWVVSQSGVGFPYAEYVTSRTVYIRFHGPGALYASSYSAEQIRTYADKIKGWMDAGCDVWVYFNNCYNGIAIENALTLRAMLQEK